MNDNNKAYSEEFQQAKIDAISKTARSIKSIYSTVLIIFIVAVVIAGFFIVKELLTNGVSVNADINPKVNEIIHSSIISNNGDINLDSNRADLKNRMILEDEDIVAINPIDDVVRNENSIDGFDSRTVDPKLLKQFHDLMNLGIEQFSDYNYTGALEVFDKARKYKEIWYGEIKRANTYYDMCMCMIDINKETVPFFDTFKLVKLTPPGNLTGKEFEGFVDKNIDLDKAIGNGDRVFLNYIHKVDGKFYQLDKTWKYEEVKQKDIVSKLKEYFMTLEQSIKRKVSFDRIHPMDYVNGIIRFALSVGDFDSFDSKTVAHNYFLDAFELDRFLFETINLYRDKRFNEWLTLVEKNDIDNAVNIRKNLTLNYPNAWEFRSDNPEKVMLEKIEAESSSDTLIDYDPSNDPEVIKKKANLANRPIREKIHFYTKYGLEAEAKGDSGWGEILKNTTDDEGLLIMLRDVIDQWRLAKSWFQEAQKLTTDAKDSQDLEHKIVTINKKIYWANKRLH